MAKETKRRVILSSAKLGSVTRKSARRAILLSEKSGRNIDFGGKFVGRPVNKVFGNHVVDYVGTNKTYAPTSKSGRIVSVGHKSAGKGRAAKTSSGTLGGSPFKANSTHRAAAKK